MRNIMILSRPGSQDTDILAWLMEVLFAECEIRVIEDHESQTGHSPQDQALAGAEA